MSLVGTVDGVDGEQLTRWILRLAPNLRWTSWQGLDRVQPALEARMLVATWEQAVLDPATHVLLEHDHGVPLAGTSVRPKPMETEHLGVVTEALAGVVCAADLEHRVDVVRRLLDRVTDDARTRGTDLLILRVPADDVQTLAAAQQAGFHVHEATMTWLADAAHATGEIDLPPGVTLEVHEGDVAGTLEPAEIAELASATAAWELNHFRADPELDDEAVDRFYAAWIHNIAAGRWSDCLSVVRYEGRVIGVQSEVSDRTLFDLLGVDVRAGEWIIVLENGRGAGRVLMSAAGRHRFPGGRFHSWETQVRNAATIRCIEQTGLARPIRAAYTLHAWPGRR